MLFRQLCTSQPLLFFHVSQNSKDTIIWEGFNKDVGAKMQMFEQKRKCHKTLSDCGYFVRHAVL